MTIFNGLFVTITMLYAACWAELGFLGSLWHGLGVGATVAGFLLLIELVAISMGNCWMHVGRGTQEDVKMRTQAPLTSKEDRLMKV